MAIEVSNPEEKLKPGMTTNLTFTIDERKNVLKVPNGALRFTPQDANGEENRKTASARSWVATDKTDNEVANRLPRAGSSRCGAMLLNRTGRSQAATRQQFRSAECACSAGSNPPRLGDGPRRQTTTPPNHCWS